MSIANVPTLSTTLALTNTPASDQTCLISNLHVVKGGVANAY